MFQNEPNNNLFTFKNQISFENEQKKVDFENPNIINHEFLGPRGLQETHMDTLRTKNSKSMTFTVR